MLNFIRLGQRNYSETLDLQFKLKAERQAGLISDTLLSVEHPRVITQGRRPAQADFCVAPEILKSRGFEVLEVSRGGKLTYHGPGQLVVYFIVSLKARRLKVAGFVRQVEATVLATLARFGLTAELHPAHPGVWMAERKIASVGLAIDREVSMHGIALNVCPDLEDFRVIVPCGMPEVEMTSMRRELDRDISWNEVEAVFIEEAKRVWDGE